MRQKEEQAGNTPASIPSDRLEIGTASGRGGIAGALGPPLPRDTVELSILTQNTWGKPGILGTNRMPRMERIARALRWYDIAGLQETFSDDCEVLLRAGGFPHGYRQDRGGPLTPNSGLTTLSRYPIEQIAFRKFATCTGIEIFVRKGILFTRLQVPGFGCVDLYNTHFQAGDGQTARAVRLDNIRELARFIRENDAGHPTILVGDFNLGEDGAEYRLLMELLHPLDSYRLANPGDPGYTCAAAPRNPYNGSDDGNSRIDYVFVLPHPCVAADILEARVANDQPQDGFMLSDHFGVATRLRFRRKP